MKEKLAQKITALLKKKFKITLRYVSEETLFTYILLAVTDYLTEHHENSRNETYATPEYPVKPPLGILPEKLWKEQRIKELIDCINRNKENLTTPQIKEWLEEVHKLFIDVNSQHPKF